MYSMRINEITGMYTGYVVSIHGSKLPNDNTLSGMQSWCIDTFGNDPHIWYSYKNRINFTKKEDLLTFILRFDKGTTTYVTNL